MNILLLLAKVKNMINMPFITSYNQVEKIFNEFSGIQPSFNFENIFKVWIALSQMDSENKSSRIFSSLDIEQKTQIKPIVARGIICLFRNLGLVTDINIEKRPYKSEITYKGSFWFNLLKDIDDQIKLAIFLNTEFKKLESVEVLLNYLQNKMPNGATLLNIEGDLGNEMEQFWELYPRYPKNNKTGTPAKKPFNKAILKDLLKLLNSLLIIQSKEKDNETFYYGPLI